MRRVRELAEAKWRIVALFLIDVACLTLSYFLILSRYGLYSLIFNRVNRSIVILAILVSVLVFRLALRVYAQVWRYANSGVYLNMVIADVLGGIVFYGVDRLFLHTFLPFVTSVAAIATGLLATLTTRFAYSFMHQMRGKRRARHGAGSEGSEPSIRVGIVGAGKLGVLLVNELRMNPASKYKPVYFFDNDPLKIGRTIEGLKVLGSDKEVVKRIHDLGVDQLIITLPNLSQKSRKQVFDSYMKTGLKVMVYDFPVERLGTEDEKPQVRDIEISDLLFREPVMLSDGEALDHYHGKTVLVTGAGGSIGSEICRQLALMNVGRLVMLDIYENGVYDVQQELHRRYPDLQVDVVIASMCDKARVEQVFARFRPAGVFHAAAHKHVPLMEDNCAEAVANNVFGTLNVVEAAEKAKVSRFVLISTDKAVNPTNIMGATKRVCEMIVQSRQSPDTDFVAVRFGNVLGSNGSVVPLFQRQIREGGPITVTHKEITRFFMTIPEAVQLVLRTGRRAERSEIYVLDMGEPVRIYDLALKMISLSGLEPGKDIEIKEVGLREGEKLYEELLIKPEECRKTEDERIFIESTTPPSEELVADVLRRLKKALEDQLDDAQIKQVMSECLPSYQPDGLN